MGGFGSQFTQRIRIRTPARLKPRHIHLTRSLSSETYICGSVAFGLRLDQNHRLSPNRVQQVRNVQLVAVPLAFPGSSSRSSRHPSKTPAIVLSNRPRFHSPVRPVGLVAGTLLPSRRRLFAYSLFNGFPNTEVPSQTHCPTPLSERQARLQWFSHLSRPLSPALLRRQGL